MGRRDPRHLVVGHLNKPHGVKGELLVQPMTDHPERVFAPGVVLSLGGAGTDEPDPDLPRLRVDAVRPVQRGLLVFFGGVESRDEAELLKGRYLFLPIDEVEPLAEGEVFYHQLLDMEVTTVDGRDLGRVTEVFELAPAHMLEVSGDGGQWLIPYLDHIVVEVDPDAGRMVIDPPEGLLDL